MFLRESPQSYGCPTGHESLPLHEVGYSAKDLALCSTEEARALIPFERAQMLKVLPLALVGSAGGRKLHCVALSDSNAKQREVRFASGCEVVLTPTSERVLEEALTRAYLGSHERLSQSFDRIADSSGASSTSQVTAPEPKGDAACFLQALVEYGFVRGASDIHLSPTQRGCAVKLRIDGELLQQRDRCYARGFHDQIVNRLKVLANLDISTRSVPQDGASVFRVGPDERHVRISILPSVHGESVVMRLAGGATTPVLSELGIEPRTLAILREALRDGRNGGIVLLTGPTGSGKTTTMYSVASELDRQGLHVVTVEDPVEARLIGPVQIQVRSEQGFSFAKAIRSVLRHDPDAVLIGEIRDAESARIALEVASTGHLTFSSLHISSALHAVGRLEVLGIAPPESVAALSLVLNQRLLPRLCQRCKQADTSRPLTGNLCAFRANGCRACEGTGRHGLVLVTELLDLRSGGAKDAIRSNRSPIALGESLSSNAFLPWALSLHHHLMCGNISWDECHNFIDQSA